MRFLPRLGQAITVLWLVPAVLSIVGGLVLLWGSQDAMLVLIHWAGEERVLGSHNVIPQAGGGKLLTNPSAMARWVLLIWAVGASQIVAGGCLLLRATRALGVLPERNL